MLTGFKQPEVGVERTDSGGGHLCSDTQFPLFRA